MFGKWLTHERATEATGGRFRVAIPKADRQGWEGGGEKTQDGTDQEGQFGEALDTFGVMDELTLGTQHLFGRQGKLFDSPAVRIEGMNAFRVEFSRRSQQPRLFEGWIMKGIDIKGEVVGMGKGLG